MRPTRPPPAEAPPPLRDATGGSGSGTRTGKIARLPHALREQLNQRLQDGQPGSVLLPWLNTHPDALPILARDFAGAPISDANLTAWRQGGYQDWLRRHEKTNRIKEMAGYAARLAKADGGHLADGASAILSGQILTILEATEGRMEPEALGELIKAVTSLRQVDIAKARQGTEAAKLDLSTQALELERAKFRRQDITRFVEWSADERAKAILAGGQTSQDKTEALGQLIFGADWK